MGKQRMKNRDGNFKSLDDPIPEPTEVELKRHGSIENWNTAVMAWRTGELRIRRGNQDGFNRAVGADARSLEEWRLVAGDLKIARNHQQQKMEQMTFIISIVEANIREAVRSELDRFPLDITLGGGDFGRKKVTDIWKGIRRGGSPKRNARVDRGFAFFDNLMRQSPRPGTIAQEVSRREDS